MADLVIKYNGSSIVDVSESITKTLLTGGKYCAGNISVEYTKPASAYIYITSRSGATLTCGSQTYTLGADETSHAFQVSVGTHTCTATLTGYNTATGSVVVSDNTVYAITLIPKRLPVAYQEVEYLQSSGTQYINTNYIPSNTADIIDTKVMLIGNNTNVAFSTMNNSAGYPGITLGKAGFRTIGQSNFYNLTLSLNETHEISLSYQSATIDGVTYTDMTKIVDMPSYSLYLFARNRMGQGADAFGTVGIYSFKVTRNNEVILNMVSCYRKSDNEPGMYDTIGNVFYTNAGTGTFIAGPDV